MPRTDFAALPDRARAWVFAATDVLSRDAETLLLTEVDAFLDEWRAHGVPLAGARDWRDGRFLCIAVDERAAGASGCSVDGLFRRLHTLEPALGTSLIAGGQVFWRNDEGVVQRATREQFATHAAAGVITAATPVFDVSVATAAAWRQEFERAASSSWHARYLSGAKR